MRFEGAGGGSLNHPPFLDRRFLRVKFFRQGFQKVVGHVRWNIVVLLRSFSGNPRGYDHEWTSCVWGEMEAGSGVGVAEEGNL